MGFPRRVDCSRADGEGREVDWIERKIEDEGWERSRYDGIAEWS